MLHALTLAITVVVVAVPEGLPMMITVVLSANMRRMLRDHVLVRRLFGIETAGILDVDSELLLVFSDGNQLQFDFRSRVDIKRICANISAYIL